MLKDTYYIDDNEARGRRYYGKQKIPIYIIRINGDEPDVVCSFTDEYKSLFIIVIILFIVT